LTYTSFWLEATKQVGGHSRLKYDLPQKRGNHFGPYDLRAWAERQGLHIEYVDNCFVSVVVPQQKLVNLFSELYGSGDFSQEVLPSIEPGWHYVLWAEEF